MIKYDDAEARQLMAKDAQERGYREPDAENQAANALLEALQNLGESYGWRVEKGDSHAKLLRIYRPSITGKSTGCVDANLKYENGAFLMQKLSEGNVVSDWEKLPLEFDLYTRTFMGPRDQNSPTGRRSPLGCIIGAVTDSDVSDMIKYYENYANLMKSLR